MTHWEKSSNKQKQSPNTYTIKCEIIAFDSILHIAGQILDIVDDNLEGDNWPLFAGRKHTRSTRSHYIICDSCYLQQIPPRNTIDFSRCVLFFHWSSLLSSVAHISSNQTKGFFSLKNIKNVDSYFSFQTTGSCLLFVCQQFLKALSKWDFNIVSKFIDFLNNKNHFFFYWTIIFNRSYWKYIFEQHAV